MLLHLIIFIIGTTPIQGEDIDVITNLLDANSEPLSDTGLEDKLEVQKVDIKLYYEALCPGCKMFDSQDLAPTVQKLSEYLDVHLYPYGKAKTIFNNGTYEFECQHGPEECYGNKLHACAIDILGTITEAVTYNSCMMDDSQSNSNSDDAAADQCGKTLNINAEPIKQCAKGPKGTELLKYYGDESKKANFHFVPYILINGVSNDVDNFERDVCAAFTAPPPPCSH